MSAAPQKGQPPVRAPEKASEKPKVVKVQEVLVRKNKAQPRLYETLVRGLDKDGKLVEELVLSPTDMKMAAAARLVEILSKVHLCDPSTR
jgi:hypothetical protein